MSIEVKCPYCGRSAELEDAGLVYYGNGRVSEKIWICRNCLAWSWCIPGTNEPRGSLANAELRHWRFLAHQALDPMWKYGRFKGYRGVAYSWLARKMGLPLERAHISMFDVRQCKKAVSIISKATKGDPIYDRRFQHPDCRECPYRRDAQLDGADQQDDYHADPSV